MAIAVDCGYFYEALETMSDYTTSPIRGVPTASAINANFDRISEAIKSVLHRDSKASNQMETDIDANGHTVSNLRFAANSSDAMPLGQMQEAVQQALASLNSYEDWQAVKTEKADSLGQVFLSDYLTEDQKYVKVEDGRVVQGRDCTSAFISALGDAQEKGRPLFLGDLHILLDGPTIVTQEADLFISGVYDVCRIYVSNWEQKQTTNLYVDAKTLFRVKTENELLNEVRVGFYGLTFINLDQETPSRIIYNNSSGNIFSTHGWRSFGFTNAVSYGKQIKDDVEGQDFDFQYTKASWLHSRHMDFLVHSDRNAADQGARGIHCSHSNDFVMDVAAIYGYNNENETANSYNIRVNGAYTASTPRPEGGAANVRVSNYHSYTENRRVEYNQISKCFNFVATNCTGDASHGFEADNMWDLFNVFQATITGHTVVGSGLAFFGHGDMGNTSFSNFVYGTRNIIVANNTIMDCEHNSVFNPGGDGNLGNERRGHAYMISNNIVFDRKINGVEFRDRLKQKYVDRGLTPPSPYKKRYFVDMFISEGVNITNNFVWDLEGFVKSSFVRSAWIDGNHLITDGIIPMAQFTDSGNGSTLIYGENRTDNRGGGFTDLFTDRGTNNGQYRMRGRPIYDDKKNVGYGTNESRTFNFKMPNSNKEVARVDITRQNSDNSAVYSRYYLLTNGTNDLEQQYDTGIASDDNWSFTLEDDRRVTITDNRGSGSGWTAIITRITF